MTLTPTTLDETREARVLALQAQIARCRGIYTNLAEQLLVLPQPPGPCFGPSPAEDAYLKESLRLEGQQTRVTAEIWELERRVEGLLGP